ncbi:hydantoinase/oxoprolinase family protein [Candidatus Korobacter versatilis]|nr:hydantoinase/oxoprolinase family protein [Candidatus Koribacter versatilis]
MAGPLRIAVDTGGTFTDCVWVERGRLRMLKVFSTPHDPSEAIASAVAQIVARVGAGPDVLLLHGTTVGTNALLERKGARVAFVTTSGFEDTLEIGRQNRPRLYELFVKKTAPLVPEGLRFGVPERVAPDGTVLRAPSDDDLQKLRILISETKPEAIALSLLFSFANPVHEKKVVEELASLEIPVSASHVVLPEFREYERASTVVVNAYLQPLMSGYLERLAWKLDGSGDDRGPSTARASHASLRMTEANTASRGRVFVMQSSGGIAALEVARREPVRTVLSGPAGGVVGCAAMARESGFTRVIGFDMGGTSTDVCLVDGEIRTSTEAEVAGLPVRVPMLDIHTVGAGGGSIARFDEGGALRVGPESAGAEPGPICYGRGVEPTVTDANLLLGRLRSDRFLGGEFALDVERTRKIVSEWLRKRAVRMTMEAFAEGVVRVVNANMERALRVVSVERGFDPREFALVAFGGAGALHACELAEALSIPTVVVPALPGALSALGILVSDVVKDFSRTVVWSVGKVVPREKLEREFRTMESRAKAEFAAEGWKGKPTIRRSVDVRYRGQGFELNIAYGAGFVAAFHAEHEKRYGYGHPEREIEMVTLRVRAGIAAPKVKLAISPSLERGASSKEKVVLGGKAMTTAVVDREAIGSGFKGPAIITEYSATTVVPPGWRGKKDAVGNLVLQRARRG